METTIYAVLVGCVVLIGIALVPRPMAQMPKLPLPRIGSIIGTRAADDRRDRHPFLLLAPLLRPLAAVIPAPAETREQLRHRLEYIGSALTVEMFRGLKVLAMAVGAFVVWIILMELKRPEPLWGILGAAAGFVAPDVWLRGRINHRNKAMLKLLPEVIDLLSLCIGAGLDFLGALNRVVAVRAFRLRREPLIEELSVVLQEVRLGKRRFDAFRAMAKRVGLAEVSSFVRSLVQADRMGTPIGEVLAVHSEDVRIQRFMRAERMALKAPIKILAPLLLCIMPCVAILVAGPVFIQFVRHNPFEKVGF